MLKWRSERSGAGGEEFYRRQQRERRRVRGPVAGAGSHADSEINFACSGGGRITR